jgi:hypothetical protein
MRQGQDEQSQMHVSTGQKKSREKKKSKPQQR